jgi:AcrR family transcriptional regulator
MPVSKSHARVPAGRARLLATARRLFTRRGAANVGINEVTEAAGVARMTLYNNFPSNEALTVAVYEEMAGEVLREVEAIAAGGVTDEKRVVALFEHFDRRARGADYRGCPFIHASLQAASTADPVYAIVSTYKRALREHVLRLLDQGRANRAELADQILLLLDGAVTEAYLKGVTDPAKAAKRAAATLLRSAR